MNFADAAVLFALAQIGKPYRRRAYGPDAFCAPGLVYAAYGSMGLRLPRTVGRQLAWGKGRLVQYKDLAPGDLVFPDPLTVQLFIGRGMSIQALKSGVESVKVDYWRGRRITSPGSTAAFRTVHQHG